MDNRRCNQRTLTISSDILLHAPKLSSDVQEGPIETVIPEQKARRPVPTCQFEKTRKLIKSLTEEYIQLEQYMEGIIAAEQIKIAANQKEVNKLKKLYNEMKMKEAENKRTRWCSYCELEASFLSSQSHCFYCSTKCEEQHLDYLLEFS